MNRNGRDSGTNRPRKTTSRGRQAEPPRRPENRPGPAPRSNGPAARNTGFSGRQSTRSASAAQTQTQALTLSAWDLARTRKGQPDTPRGHIMTLRAHQKLVDSFEKERNIPVDEHSFLRVQEEAKGSCLLIHGVSSGPGDLKELATVLYDAGLNVYVLRLPDHGTPDTTLSEVSWGSSLRQARQCYQLLAKGGGKVHVMGLGFGAALALHLAGQESVSSLILMSPAIMPRESFMQRLMVRLKLHQLGFLRHWLGWDTDLIEGMDQARSKISKIKVPIFAAQCEDDDRSSSKSLRILQSKAPHTASRFRIFPTGGHGVLAAHGEAGLFKEIVEFCVGG